jgi:hypothetical protein
MREYFLPKEQTEGKIGYYPCADTKEYANIPLPMKCMTWFKPINQVEFEAWFSNYNVPATVRVHCSELPKVLFCLNQGNVTLYLPTQAIFWGCREAILIIFQQIAIKMTMANGD